MKTLSIIGNVGLLNHLNLHKNMYFIYYIQKHSVQWENEKGTWQLYKNTNEKVKEYFPAHMRKGPSINYGISRERGGVVKNC